MCSPTLIIAAVGTAVTAIGQIRQSQAQAQAQEVNARNQAQATETQARNAQIIGEYNAQVAETNSELQTRAATDVIRRGANDAAVIRENARRTSATGRAVQGSTGLLVDTGTFGDLIDENIQFGELNARTTINNAEREAFGFKVGAIDELGRARGFRLQGDLGVSAAESSAANIRAAGTSAAAGTRRSGFLSAAGTLVTGASDFGKFGGEDFGKIRGSGFQPSKSAPPRKPVRRR